MLAYGEPLDLRRSFDGLLAVARRSLSGDVLSGTMFVFINRTLMKAVFWDRTGWCVLAWRHSLLSSVMQSRSHLLTPTISRLRLIRRNGDVIGA